MPEQSRRSLNHFAVVRFRAGFWDLSPEQRGESECAIVQALHDVGDACHVYQTFPMTADADLLVWTAAGLGGAGDPACFFERMASALAKHRHLIEVEDVLWGITRPSPYSRGRSRRAIEPLGRARASYLIAYPFSKTAEWYRLPAERRQDMMNEHIRVGRSHEGIDQLLLYSVGLQDHEFVVVYETDDLERFSALVTDLRQTEARRYTARDTPVRIGLYRGHSTGSEQHATPSSD